MFDTNKEQPYTASELSWMLKDKKNIDRNEKTIRAWMTNGVNGILLESIPVGGVRVSSLEAIERFFQKLAERGAKGFQKINGMRNDP